MKKKKSIVMIVAVLAFALLLMVGCAEQPAAEDETPESPLEVTVSAQTIFKDSDSESLKFDLEVTIDNSTQQDYEKVWYEMELNPEAAEVVAGGIIKFSSKESMDYFYITTSEKAGGSDDEGNKFADDGSLIVTGFQDGHTLTLSASPEKAAEALQHITVNIYWEGGSQQEQLTLNVNIDESALPADDTDTQDVENQPQVDSEDVEQPPEDSEEQEDSDDPNDVTLEDFLAMTDEELALSCAGVELVQQDGAYVLNADLSQWAPVTTGTVVSGDGSEADAGTTEGNPGANLLFRQNFGMVIYCEENDAEKAEETALLMAKRFLHLCMNPMVTSSQTKFIVTAYKDLSVDVYTWDELPEEYQQQIEPMVLDETSIRQVWYVIPTVTYQYKGTMNGIESDGTEWFTESYSGNCCLQMWLMIPDFEGMEDDPQLEQWPHLYDPRFSFSIAII